MKAQSQSISEVDLVFAPEDESKIPSPASSESYWKILIIDDEPDIHEVTKMSLKNFEFAGRKLEFLNAYSAEQAKTILNEANDIAIALVDVVMESEHAGLDLVKYICNDLENDFIRLILRTGQPGQAPESRRVRWLQARA